MSSVTQTEPKALARPPGRCGPAWLCLREDDDEYTVHVIPIDDVVMHDEAGIGCVCGPRLERIDADDGGDAWLVSHASLDGRELLERKWLG